MREAGRRGAVGIVVGAMALTALVGCGGDDGGTELPAPPEGRATVGGTLEVDGEASAGSRVRLSGTAEAETETDDEGLFVFEDVEPGDYGIAAEVAVDLPEGDDGDAECTADGYEGGFSIGNDGGLVLTLLGEELDVAADATVVEDITVECG